jgi:hypothetical protein
MSSDVQDMAKKALLRLVKGAATRAVERAERPKPASAFAEDAPKKSEDALDRPAFRKGGFSRSEKRAYAQKKLVQPPKNPPPEWLSDPTLLPKKPPTRAG